MEILPARYDVIFKALFTNKSNEDCLRAFLSALLLISEEEIVMIEIQQNEFVPDSYIGKISRLDLIIKVNNKLVNVEIQLSKHAGYIERSIFYPARIISSSLISGQAYSELPEVISINILNFGIFPFEEYSSMYKPIEVSRGDVLTDKLTICFFELPKLMKKKANLESKRERWLRFLNAETEEELVMLEQLNDPTLNKAIGVVRYMSKDESLREQVRLREKAEMDRLSDMKSARMEGINIGRAEGINIGMERGIEKGLVLGTIRTAFDFGQSKDQVTKYVMKKHNLSIDEANNYINEYLSKNN